MPADQQPPPASSPHAPATPAPDLGPGLVATAVVPGRNSVAIQRTRQGTHALNHLVQDSTAAFALELGADGAATACRGWRYRGRYTLAGGIAEVELNTDDTVCPPKREADLALTRSPSIKLRCVLAAPHGHPLLTTPALLCEWVGVQTDEPMAYAVDGLGLAGWMALGAGNGLRVKVAGQPPGSRAGEPTKVTAAPSAAPLGELGIGPQAAQSHPDWTGRRASYPVSSETHLKAGCPSILGNEKLYPHMRRIRRTSKNGWGHAGAGDPIGRPRYDPETRR